MLPVGPIQRRVAPSTAPKRCAMQRRCHIVAHLGSCGIQFETLTIMARLGARDPRRQTMLRKLTIILAVIAAIGVAAIPTGASAAWRGGGWHGGGWHGGWRGPGWGWGVGAGLLGGAIIGGAFASPYYYGYGPYYYGGGPYYGGCYRTIRVSTPYGPRLRRVWVCE
jgi:hypothetical protein